MKANMWEKCLLLKIDHHFNLTESGSSSESKLHEDATNAVHQKCSRKMRLNALTEGIEVAEINDLEADIAPPK